VCVRQGTLDSIPLIGKKTKRGGLGRHRMDEEISRKGNISLPTLRIGRIENKSGVLALIHSWEQKTIRLVRWIQKHGGREARGECQSTKNSSPHMTFGEEKG